MNAAQEMQRLYRLGWTLNCEVLFFWTRPMVLYFVAGMLLALGLRRLSPWPPRISPMQAAVVAVAVVLVELVFAMAQQGLPLWLDTGLLSAAVLVLALPQAGAAGGVVSRGAQFLGDASSG